MGARRGKKRAPRSSFQITSSSRLVLVASPDVIRSWISEPRNQNQIFHGSKARQKTSSAELVSNYFFFSAGFLSPALASSFFSLIISGWVGVAPPAAASPAATSSATNGAATVTTGISLLPST